MKAQLHHLKKHYHYHKERFNRLWEESLLTRAVSFALVGVSTVSILGFTWNHFHERQNPDTPLSESKISTEHYENLEMITSPTEVTLKSASSKKEATLTAPLTKNTPVYGVQNTLQLEKDIQRSLVERGATEAVKSVVNSTKRLESTYIDTSDLLSKHINILRQIRSYLSINLITYTKGASDKVKLLSDLENKLKDAIAQSQGGINELESEIARLKDEYNRHNAAKKAASSSFSEKLSNFDANGTKEQLAAVIKEEQEAAEFYSTFKSFEKLRDIYKALQKPFATKLKVLQANREALIKEVQVVNIPGMQEDFILSEQEWKTLIGN